MPLFVNINNLAFTIIFPFRERANHIMLSGSVLKQAQFTKIKQSSDVHSIFNICSKFSCS